ncbi:unnamed protein product [Trichogramma brassicae]|uniref:CCHC-type domain-containing protein n=1 Tax=Trichogramma brassicae TaxID=86971 RepID=A0A6H5IYB0_9HYME|nr:unnamed protein product [Trichogramma brassicae]
MRGKHQRQRYRQHLAPRLLYKIWRNADIPEAWMHIMVTMLPKGGDNSDPNNYRPIALVNAILEPNRYPKISLEKLLENLSKNENEENWASQIKAHFFDPIDELAIWETLNLLSSKKMLSRIDWSSMAENDAVEIIRCTIAGASEASVRSSCMMNGLNVDDDVNKLRDRLMRFEIRTRFGDDKAMWDPVQDVASQMSAVTAASNNQAAVEATPLASSPNKLGNNFRHWRNMHNISESSSLMDTVIDGNAERARRVAEEESAESVAESELRDRVEDRVHTEQQRALESSNEGRSESENREEIVHSSEREEQIAPSEFERGPAAGATSTARRVAFANDANAMNKNKADRATVSGVDGATPAAYVTARSQLYQSEILGAGGNARGGANEHRAGDATGSRGSDDARGNRGLNTGTEIGGRGRTGSREPRGTTSSRTGLRERGGSLTRYENSRYGANANGWSSVPDSTRGERRNSMSNSAWNGSLGFNSTLARERNTCDLYRQWGLVFRDAGKSNPEMFITRLMTCAGRYQLSLDDICRTLPAVLDMEACAWLEREEREWETLDDMAEAFRLQYCDEGTQQCLRQEIEARTQGPKEEISVFLLKIRLLLDQLKPPLCLSEQIDRAYMNLHPSYRRAFSREQCVSFREFQKLGKLEELKRRQELAYREPPKSDNVMFRNAAYVEPEESKERSVAAVVIASVEEKEKEKVKEKEKDKKSEHQKPDKEVRCYRCQKRGHIAARCRTRFKCEKCGVDAGRFRLCNKCYRERENNKSDKKDKNEKSEAPSVAVISDRGVSVHEAALAPEVNGRMIEVNVADPTAMLVIENVARKKISPRTDRVQEMAARSRTRSVTFRYSRLPGMSLQGEFPAGSVVYRQVMFRCTNNVRACYRGGRHICLTVNRPCASPYSENEETEENEEDREKEKPSDVLPGVAVMGTAAEECTAEEAMVVGQLEEVTGEVAEGDLSKERSLRSESAAASETESRSATDSESTEADERAARELDWPPEDRPRWDEPEPRVDLRALGVVRPGCWNCGEQGGGHSHSNCPDPVKRRYCYWCGWPGKSKSTCPTHGPLWMKFLAAGKTRSFRRGFYKRRCGVHARRSACIPKALRYK